MNLSLTSNSNTRSVISPLRIPDIWGWWDSIDTFATLKNNGSKFLPANNGDPVTKWYDKSGKGNHLIQFSEDSRPVLNVTSGPNGNRSLVFDGIDDILASNPVTGSQNTIFIVLYQTQYSDESVIFDTNNTGERNKLSQVNVPGRLEGSFGPILTKQQIGVWNIITLESSDDFKSLRLGSSGKVIQDTPSPLLEPIEFVIGGSNFNNPTNHSNIRISELIIYRRILNEEEQTIIRSYLTNRWGVFYQFDQSVPCPIAPTWPADDSDYEVWESSIQCQFERNQ
jgi:hypothetical protein